MNITQRGVLPPVNFAELDASLQSSLLGPAGTRIVRGADFAPTLTEGTNGGVVNLTVGEIDIVTLGSMAFTLGQLVFFMAQVDATKGATLGAIELTMEFLTGTGAVQWRTAQTRFSRLHPGVPVGNTFRGVLSGLAVCTTAGNATPRLRGQSFGSDSTVGIGSGQLAIRVI